MLILGFFFPIPNSLLAKPASHPTPHPPGARLYHGGKTMQAIPLLFTEDVSLPKIKLVIVREIFKKTLLLNNKKAVLENTASSWPDHFTALRKIYFTL